MHTTISPAASAKARFSAVALPPFSLCRTSTRGSSPKRSVSRAKVSSVEPSSTTITWREG